MQRSCEWTSEGELKRGTLKGELLCRQDAEVLRYQNRHIFSVCAEWTFCVKQGGTAEMMIITSVPAVSLSEQKLFYASFPINMIYFLRSNYYVKRKNPL